MSEPLPCPQCGVEQLVEVVEDCRLEDGLTVKRLRHLKCLSCGARYFDDEAMHRIQTERDRHGVSRAVSPRPNGLPKGSAV